MRSLKEGPETVKNWEINREKQGEEQVPLKLLTQLFYLLTVLCWCYTFALYTTLFGLPRR